MQKTLKTRFGRALVLPTPEEDAAINAGIASDPETYELTDREFARLQPVCGEPQVEKTKVHARLRLDARVE
ncbi:MAG: hypothetical protein LBP68_06735 [Acidobacteriota bacterium]|jgi:hypothetical protein|nr:hypothetical protein [Acidobacteriota bacterium]